MAFNQEDVVVKFGADATGLQQGTAQAAQAVESATGKMNGAFGQLKDLISGQSQSVVSSFGAIGDAIGKLGGAFASAGALLAGGAVFKGAIQAASDEAGEVKKLMNSLGMTSDAASKMKIALELVGMSEQDYVGIAMKFDRQLKSNEEGLKVLGVVTRDHNGSLLSQDKLLQNATETMMTYKAGTDRNAFAMTAFGRSADDAFKLLKLDDGVKKRADELAVSLGEIVSDKDLQEMKDYKIATAAAGVVVGSFAENLGAAVIPMLTETANVFVDVAKRVMPYVQESFEVTKEVFSALGRIIKNTTGLIISLFSGIEQKGHETFAQKLPEDAWTWAHSMQMVALALLVVEKAIQEIFLTITYAAIRAGNAINTVKAIADAPFSLKSPFDEWEKGAERATKAKAWFDAGQKDIGSGIESRLKGIFFPEESATRHAGAGNREYVDPKDAGKGGGSSSGGPSAKDNAAEQARLAAEAEKLSRDTQRAEIEGERHKAKSIVEIDQELLNQKLALGEISTEQFLQQTKTLEDRRYALEKAALEDRKKLDEQDPKNAPRVKADYAALEVLENQHIAKSIAAQTKLVTETRKQWASLFSSISSGMGKAVGGFIVGTQGLGASLKGIYTSIQTAFSDMLGKMVTDWIQKHLMMLFFKQTTQAAEATGDAAAAVGQVATAKVAAAATIPAEAGIAAGGAASAVAATPIFGPSMAAAAYASTMAMVMSGLAVASASGGYDIPAGINPLTQLHQNEMVLPAKYADVIRGMDSNTGGEVHVHIDAIDAASFQRRLDQHGPAIFDSLKHQIRNLRR